MSARTRFLAVWFVLVATYATGTLVGHLDRSYTFGHWITPAILLVGVAISYARDRRKGRNNVDAAGQ